MKYVNLRINLQNQEEKYDYQWSNYNQWKKKQAPSVGTILAYLETKPCELENNFYFLEVCKSSN